jgi:hypothetical protein
MTSVTPHENLVHVCELLRRNDASVECLEIDLKEDDCAIMFADSLRGNTRLRKLTLTLGGETLTSLGATRIVTALSTSYVSWLVFVKNPSCPYIECLVFVLGHLPSLVSLQRLTINGLGYFCFNNICLYSFLRILPSFFQLSTTTDQVFGNFNSFHRGLSQTSSLRVLELQGGYPLSIDRMQLIRPTFEMNHTIKSLILRNCRIRPNAALEFFGNPLPLHGTLQSLDLSGSMILTQSACTVLQSVIATDTANSNLVKEQFALSNPAVLSIFLNNNQSFGYSGLELLGNLLPMLPLRELHLQGCVHPNDSTNTATLKKRAAHALIEGMKKNIHLHVLDVSGNDFAPIVGHLIHYYTSLNQVGHGMAANDVFHVPSLRSLLLARYQGTTFQESIIYFILRENPHFAF